MIRNTGMVPLDMQKTQQISGATLLTIDRWDTHAGSQLLGTETVDFAKLGSRPCPVGSVSRDSLLELFRAETPIEDCRVLQLLLTSIPQAAGSAIQCRGRGSRARSLLGPLLELARLRSRDVEGGFRRSGNGAAAGGVPAGRLGVCAPLHCRGRGDGEQGAALRVHPAVLVLLPLQRCRQQARSRLGTHQRRH